MTALRAGAKKTRDKMQQATDLIGGLAGERKRWTEDSAKFDATKTALVGDVAVGAIAASRRGESRHQLVSISRCRGWFRTASSDRDVPQVRDHKPELDDRGGWED